jgi:DNA-binding NarL/FixJ family response regulator
LLKAAAELKPDVAIVDIAMPLLNGLEAGGQVKKIHSAIKVIYLTMNSDPEIAAEAFRRGGSGYLLKTSPSAELLVAVREVLRGTSYISKALPEDVIDYLRKQDREMVKEDARLTERQREVLRLLVEGKSMREVAQILNLAPRTVAFHKYRIMEVLDIRSDAELVKYAIRNNIIAA